MWCHPSKIKFIYCHMMCTFWLCNVPEGRIHVVAELHMSVFVLQERNNMESKKVENYNLKKDFLPIETTRNVFEEAFAKCSCDNA